MGTRTCHNWPACTCRCSSHPIVCNSATTIIWNLYIPVMFCTPHQLHVTHFQSTGIFSFLLETFGLLNCEFSLSPSWNSWKYSCWRACVEPILLWGLKMSMHWNKKKDPKCLILKVKLGSAVVTCWNKQGSHMVWALINTVSSLSVCSTNLNHCLPLRKKKKKKKSAVFHLCQHTWIINPFGIYSDIRDLESHRNVWKNYL